MHLRWCDKFGVKRVKEALELFRERREPTERAVIVASEILFRGRRGDGEESLTVLP